MHKVRQVELSCILREPQGIENQYDMITTVAGVRESRGRLVLCRTECTTLAHVPDVLETERRIFRDANQNSRRPTQDSSSE